MKEKFANISFKPGSLVMVERINRIIASYQAQGYTLSLRQLYYQLVSRDLIENTTQSYKRTGDLVNNARLAGLIDWAAIEDRGREYLLPSHWTEPGSIIDSAAYSYRINKWAEQPNHVEVMVEKDALSGVLGPVCQALDIGFTANRGYSSSSNLYEAGKRMARAAANGKEVYVLYLGDHDPSGMDMTRDVLDRLGLFSGCTIAVDRLALNMEQVRQYNPPENPTKTTDSRADAYILQFGTSSWELDALEPNVLAALVRSAVERLRDEDLWEASVAEEEEARAGLQQMAQRYQELVAYLRNGHGNP